MERSANTDLKVLDLEGAEEWREYDFGREGALRTYRIERPVSVTWRIGGTTHRVLDQDGVQHLVPAPGFEGCVVRFKGRVVA